MKGIIIVAAGFVVLLVLVFSGVLTPLMTTLFQALTGESNPNTTEEPQESETPNFSATPQVSRNISISYTIKTAQFISSSIGRVEPDPGNLFLTATITIANNGYDSSFNTNPALFNLRVNNTNYSVDTLGTGILDDWYTINVANGETYSGKLVFQIPTLTGPFEFGYSQPISPYMFSIIWKQN